MPRNNRSAATHDSLDPDDREILITLDTPAPSTQISGFPLNTLPPATTTPLTALDPAILLIETLPATNTRLVTKRGGRKPLLAPQASHAWLPHAGDLSVDSTALRSARFGVLATFGQQEPVAAKIEAIQAATVVMWEEVREDSAAWAAVVVQRDEDAARAAAAGEADAAREGDRARWAAEVAARERAEVAQVGFLVVWGAVVVAVVANAFVFAA